MTIETNRRLRGMSFDFASVVVLHKAVVFKRMFDRRNLVMIVRYDKLITNPNHPRSRIEWYYDLATKSEVVVLHPSLGRQTWTGSRWTR